MATKKKVTRTKRAPRQVWLVVSDAARDVIPASATTRKRALELVEDDGERVVGPYVLAERVRER